MHMNTAVINIKTEQETKDKAQLIAKDLGLSLSSLVNAFLKQIVRTKKIEFSLDEKPSDYLIKAIKKASEDRKHKKASPIFKNGAKAIEWLEQQGI